MGRNGGFIYLNVVSIASRRDNNERLYLDMQLEKCMQIWQ